ncbi:MAG TPA: CRISPR-associated endonuclease Cas1 [Spirochaetota bacterium]|nr:CRISPR-associated endonuclease Cas1 [Spirochaetota bacterium]
MQQSVLYVCEQGTSVHKSGESVVIKKDGKALLEVESFRLGTVCLVGAVQVSTQATTALIDEGIDISFLSYGGRCIGRIEGALSKNIPLRLRQYDIFADSAARDVFAREIVGAKLEAQREMLLAYQKNHTSSEIAAGIAGIGEMLAKVAEASRDSLRGIEGTAARWFFQAVRAILPPEFDFEGRNRRPPRDPVNAMLSFAYTVAGNEMTAFVQACGLDPHLGLWHEPEYGRTSLALDLLEPFRPDIDAMVVRMFNRKVFTTADFTTTDEEGCRFTESAIKRFFAEYEKTVRGKEPGDVDPERRMTGLRREMVAVVQSFAGWLRSRAPSRPGLPPVTISPEVVPQWLQNDAQAESTAIVGEQSQAGAVGAGACQESAFSVREARQCL